MILRFCAEHGLKFTLGRVARTSGSYFARIESEQPAGWDIQCESDDPMQAMFAAFERAKQKILNAE